MQCETINLRCKIRPFNPFSNKLRVFQVNFPINAAFEHLRMRCLFHFSRKWSVSIIKSIIFQGSDNGLDEKHCLLFLIFENDNSHERNKSDYRMAKLYYHINHCNATVQYFAILHAYKYYTISRKSRRLKISTL